MAAALRTCHPLVSTSKQLILRAFSKAAVTPANEPIAVTALHLHKKEKVLEVSFSNGSTHRFSAELLRVCSPSAENCGTGSNVKCCRAPAEIVKYPHATTALKNVPAGRRHVGIMGLEPVGNYAVRITFDDLHSTGLYTWDYLHELGCQRFSKAKQYIKTLRDQGLSRDPKTRKPKAR